MWTKQVSLFRVSLNIDNKITSHTINQNADSLERENGASFCHLWMGNLVVYIHLRLPVCSRQ